MKTNLSPSNIETARQQVADRVRELEENAPYLDHKDFKPHGKIATELLDGKVSMQSMRDVEALPEEAIGLAEHTRKRYENLQGIRHEVGLRNLEQSRTEHDDDWMVVAMDRPDLLQKSIDAVTDAEVSREVAHLKEQEAWYREGAVVAQNLVEAVRTQKDLQPATMTVMETLRDAALRAKRRLF